MSSLGEALTDRSLSPPLAALVVWNANPAAVAPDQEQVLAGLEREDLFTVVLEQFMTDTARYADVILPATTQLEHTDVLFSWGHHYLTMNEAAIAPLGEALPNTEIFRSLAAALGLDDPSFHETDEELLAALFSKGGPADIGLDRLRREGFAKVDLGQGPTPHANGGFRTSSGKLELEAAALAGKGLDTLPFYDAPAEIGDRELARRFPLCLLTPKTHLFLNSTFANGRRQAAAQPQPFVVVHPADAEVRGLADGALARVFNDRGSFVACVRISDDAPAGAVVSPMGWWNGAWPQGRSCQATTSQRLTGMIPSPTFNDNRVEVELHSS
jgi:anaerobic selenocysteine-containing dehydrogenase